MKLVLLKAVEVSPDFIGDTFTAIMKEFVFIIRLEYRYVTFTFVISMHFDMPG
jgi:hypothetical protein